MGTIPEHRCIRSRTRQAARCATGTKEQAAQRTAGFTADGFLNHRFLPLCRPADNLPAQQQVEKGFFTSLSILAGLCNYQPMPVNDYPYPANILLAHWEASLEVSRHSPQSKLSLVQCPKGNIRLAATERFDTNCTLYYIPVIPLYRILRDKRQRKAAELLLSVFAYLYRIAGVPYYRDPYSALAYYYDMVAEWLIECEYEYEAKEFNYNFSEINAAASIGDVMLRRMTNPCHLEHFANRIARFQPRNPFEDECLRIARTALNIYARYPDRNIFDNIRREKQDYEEEVIRAEQYISFVADTDGWLYENITDMVNNEFNECMYMEEPTVTQVFDHKAKTLANDISFETKLFELITDLCSLLNNTIWKI